MNTIAKEKFDRMKQIKDELFKDKDNPDLIQELTEINKDLKEDALKMFSEESAIKNFLDNIYVFNNYSYNNQLLIHLQKPDAKFVASFKTYKDLGYSVTKDPDSIKIITPVQLVVVADAKNKLLKLYSQLTDEEKEIYKDKNNDDIIFHSKKTVNFKIGTVFDITDSTMPYEEIHNTMYPNVKDDNAEMYIDAVEKVIKGNNFLLEYKTLNGTTEGYTSFEENKIVIDKNLTGVAKLKVMLHELAHSLAHTNLKNNYEEYKKDRSRYEVEAESISYSVAKYLNINMGKDSYVYLYNYSKNKDFEELDKSLETIVNISKKIISGIEEKTLNLTKDNELTLEV